MIVWRADGEIVTFRTRWIELGLRLIDLGGYKVYIDSETSAHPNKVASAFGLHVRGSFGIEDGANFVRICTVFRNVLLYHDLIFGTVVKDIHDVNFAVFLPSYDSIFEYMEWSDFESDESQCGVFVQEARLAAFRDRLSPEEFFQDVSKYGMSIYSLLE